MQFAAVSRHLAPLFVAALALLIAAPMTSGAEIVARNTTSHTLQVNSKGIAKVTYKVGAKRYCVLYRDQSSGHVADRTKKKSLRFRYDRSCGWRSKWVDYKAKFANSCKRYSGPLTSGTALQPNRFHDVVKSCTAKDGSHWMLQKWARLTPNYGGSPAASPKELRISHFNSDGAPSITVRPNWSWNGRFMHLVAQLTYRGAPWYAMAFTEVGAVTDQIGRNIAIDSLHSDMGSGWRRVNAILTHRPSGQMCYGFTPKDTADQDPSNNKKSGTGYSSVNRYRVTVPGPGVSPDVQYEFNGVTIAQYTREADEAANAYIHSLVDYNPGNVEHSCNNIDK